MTGHPKRGQIWLVDFRPTTGAEINKKRPACIISNDICNEFSLTVTVLPITDQGSKIRPYEVALVKAETGLVKDSKIKCQQIKTIDKRRIIKYMGAIPKEKIRNVERALAIHLGIVFRD